MPFFGTKKNGWDNICFSNLNKRQTNQENFVKKK